MAVGDYFVADRNIIKLTEISNPYGQHFVLRGTRIAPDGSWDFFLFHGVNEFFRRAQKIRDPWCLLMLSSAL